MNMKNLSIFFEVHSVKHTILQQIITAVKPKYLRALQTPGTDRLTCTIPQLFSHLFDTYGDVTPSELRELSVRVESITLLPSESVYSIFTEINELAAIAEIVKAHMTPTQKINMSYILFKTTCL